MGHGQYRPIRQGQWGVARSTTPACGAKPVLPSSPLLTRVFPLPFPLLTRVFVLQLCLGRWVGLALEVVHPAAPLHVAHDDVPALLVLGAAQRAEGFWVVEVEAVFIPGLLWLQEGAMGSPQKWGGIGAGGGAAWRKKRYRERGIG